MFHTRKLSCLMLIVLLGLCFVVFAQVVKEKKPIVLTSVVPPSPVCPGGTQANALIQIDFTGLTTSTYTIPGPGPNNPLVMTPPQSAYGTYYITDNPHNCNGQWIQDTQGQGNILVCDGFADKPTKLFGKTVTNLVPGNQYNFCARFKNIYPSTPVNQNPKVKLKIRQISGGDIDSVPLTLTPGATWQSLALPWACPTGCTQATLEIWLVSNAGNGNDIGVDDISFVECKPICMCDHWDPVGIQWVQQSLEISIGTAKCEDRFNLGDVCQCEKISLFFKYICKRTLALCNPSYSWKITGPNMYELSGTSSTTTCNISFMPTELGDYICTVTPTCGDTTCQKCKLTLYVNRIVQCKVIPHGHPPDTEADKVQ